MKPIVFDASAIMAWFQGKSGSEKVEEWLDLGEQGKRGLLMSVVNWGEVYYATWVRSGEQAARRAEVALARLPIEIVTADAELTLVAARLKARHGLPYADGFAAGLAIVRDADLATADKHFERVRHLVSIRML